MLKRSSARRGIAAMELAVLLPFLAFIWVVTVDFCRVFYYTTIVTFCARDGAIYGCADATHAADTTGIKNAAILDDSSLPTDPNVSSTTGTDASSNPFVKVTVSYTFNTVTSFPGVPNAITISRSTQMRVSQTMPN